jgi:hypothetical protein
MTSEEEFRRAFASLEVNEDFTEAVVGMRDGSQLCFCHRVGERWVKVVCEGEVNTAGQLLPLIGMFRLNRKHLDIQFQDGGRWEARFGHPEQSR